MIWDKLLAHLVYPLSIGLFLILLAYVFVPFRIGLTRFILSIAFLILFLFSTSIGAYFILNTLESSWHYYPPDQAPKAELGIVLSGGINHGRFSANYLDSIDRLIYAAQLYRQGKVNTLLVTGGCACVQGPARYNEAALMKDFLIQMGVPAHRIEMESASRNTKQNAEYSRHLIGHRSALLITSAYHMRRALMIFRSMGMDPVPAPTDFINPFDFDHWTKLIFQPLLWLPSAYSLHLSTLAIKEYIGYWVYQHRQWFWFSAQN